MSDTSQAHGQADRDLLGAFIELLDMHSDDIDTARWLSTLSEKNLRRLAGIWRVELHAMPTDVISVTNALMDAEGVSTGEDGLTPLRYIKRLGLLAAIELAYRLDWISVQGRLSLRHPERASIRLLPLGVPMLAVYGEEGYVGKVLSRARLNAYRPSR